MPEGPTKPDSYELLAVPRAAANDDAMRVVEWLVEDGTRVEPGQVVAMLEGSKTVLELETRSGGFLYHLAGIGELVAVGNPVGAIAQRPERPRIASRSEGRADVDHDPGQVVTKRARELLDRHNLPLDPFANLPVVKSRHVEAYLEGSSGHPAGIE